MKKRTPVSDIMTKNVITLNTTDDLEKAENLFKLHNIRHIPVVSGEAIIGMLTIQQVMAKNLISVSSNTTIKEVAELLSKKEFHALPVVDNNVLVGIVTTTDLINYLINQF